MHVLLVEDDLMVGVAIRTALLDASHQVEWVVDVASALEALNRHAYEMLLLDLGLPDGDGIEILDFVRRHGSVRMPVLIQSARNSLSSRLRGLNQGADDYLVKPFDTGELLARMRAVARHRPGSAMPVIGNRLVSLNPTTREAHLPQRRPVRLSQREYSLLRALLVRPGAILSRTQLETRLYDDTEHIDSNAVEFLIHSLRSKLGSQLIRNVRGVGWTVEQAP